MRAFYRKHQRGLTLIEALIVVAIMGILAFFGIPKFLGAQQTTIDNTCRRNLSTIGSAIATYRTANGVDPTYDQIKDDAGDPECPLDKTKAYDVDGSGDSMAARCANHGTLTDFIPGGGL